MYRSAASTLVSRCRKKLTEKTNWYRKRKGGGEEDKIEERKMRTKMWGEKRERKVK